MNNASNRTWILLIIAVVVEYFAFGLTTAAVALATAALVLLLG